MVATKQCCRCLETKPLAAFNLKPQAACKACINLYQAVYRERNRELRNAEGRIRYQKITDRLLAYGAQYREQNRDKLRAHQRAYASKEEIKIKDREHRTRYNEELRDAIVRRSLIKGTTLKPKDIPPELIEIKRTQLKIRRALLNGNDTRSQG